MAACLCFTAFLSAAVFISVVSDCMKCSSFMHRSLPHQVKGVLTEWHRNLCFCHESSFGVGAAAATGCKKHVG